MKIQVKNTMSLPVCCTEKAPNNSDGLVVCYGNHNDFENRLSRYYSFLTEKEIRRSKRFLKKNDERVYTISHALLNRKITKHLKTDFETLKINYFDSRKPYIKDSPIDFNLSHSADCFAFAISCEKNTVVGVDIENIKENFEFESIVKHYFHENEIKYVFNGDLNNRQQLQRFYEIWTRKEAFFKMLGLGLSEKFPETDLSSGEREIQFIDTYLSEPALNLNASVSTFVLPNMWVLSVAANTPSKIILTQCGAF